MSIQQQVYKILSEILEIKVNDTTNISMQTCEKWTSLAHIDIIMSCEEEFGITFGQDDLPLIASQEDLVKKIIELAQ